MKVLGQQNCWPQALNGILFAFRTATHKSTGVTPYSYELMYARKPVLPLHLVGQEGKDLEEEGDIGVDLELEEVMMNVKDLQENLESIPRIQQVVEDEVMKNTKKAQACQKKDHENRHGQKKQFEIGDEVLLFNLRRADQKGGKGAARWDGPYVVKKCVP